MLGYLPRTLQLKLFRYALSKLDFLDHSTYDVEKDFNLSLGLKNELEMKNIGLNISKISSLLSLPPSVLVSAATVTSLHIRIPADFHKAPVRVTISGIRLGAALSLLPDESDPSYGVVSEKGALNEDPDDKFKIPSGIDLASSYIHERPLEAREVEDALQSDPTVNLDYDDYESQTEDTGFGTQLGFWNLIPSFFERLVDRVEIDIRDVSLVVEAPYTIEGGLKLNSRHPATFAVELRIESLEVEGVTTTNNISTLNTERKKNFRPGMRAIRLEGISLVLLAPGSFFESSMGLDFPSSNIGDTDTIKSDSTVLPSEDLGGRKYQANTGYVSPQRNAQPSTADALSEGATNASSFASGFFAAMQEPSSSRYQTGIDHQDSHHSNFVQTGTPILANNSSSSSETESDPLSGSILIAAEHTTPMNESSDRSITHVNTFPTQDHFGSKGDTKYDGINDDDDDDDSLGGESRDLDLFQEPNIKYLAGLELTTPRGSDSSAEKTRSEPQTDIPRDNALDLSRGTFAEQQTNSQLQASFLGSQSLDLEEYTRYYEDPEDLEYSNPDLLFLSERVESETGSSENSQLLEPKEETRTVAEPVVDHPSVVLYATSDSGQSDSESIYQSYPASEFDASVSNLEAQLSPQNRVSPLPVSNQEPPIGETPPLESGPAEEQSTFNPQEAVVTPKEPRSTMPNVSLEAQSVSASVSPSSSHHGSIPENFDSTLAESMLFSHEEAGSLYMSALGNDRNMFRSNDTKAFDPDLTKSSVFSLFESAVQHREIVRIDFVDVFVSGISKSGGLDAMPEEMPLDSRSNASESIYPSMPGAFSLYAGKHAQPKSALEPQGPQPQQKRSKPTVSFETHKEPNLQSLEPIASSNILNESELGVEIGKVVFEIDLATSHRLSGITPGIMSTINPSAPAGTVNHSESQNRPGFLCDIYLTSLEVGLFDKLPPPSQDLHNTINTTNDPESINTLEPIMKFYTAGLSCKQKAGLNPQTGQFSSTCVEFRECSIRVGKHEILGLVPDKPKNQASRHPQKRKGPHVLTIQVNETARKRHVHIEASSIRLYFPTRDIEEMVSYFGGIESLLNTIPGLGAAATTTETVRPLRESAKPASATDHNENLPESQLSTNIAGITIEVYISDSTGGIGISMSALKLNFGKPEGLVMRIPQVAILGPDISSQTSSASASTLLALNGIMVSFDSTPQEKDLELLLNNITPSTDGYENDNLMVDVLLRQRRQGSVVRVEIENFTGTMERVEDISRFSAIAEELSKMATVAKYIPQDERPGMLTLLSLQRASFKIFAGSDVQDISAKLHQVQLSHVATPSLLALQVGQLFLQRQLDEEWVGEALPRTFLASRKGYTKRPMIRARFIGDEPEPEVKVKIWNTRFEYHVQSLLSLFSLSAKDTSDVVATNMVNSIADIAEREVLRQLQESQKINPQHEDTVPPFRIKISLEGVAIGLNPIFSTSKGMVIVQQGSFVCSVSKASLLSATLGLSKANLVVIDDRESLVALPRAASLENTDRRLASAEELSGYTTQGFVPVIAVSSATINLELESKADTTEKDLVMSVNDIFIVIESCADSTQTLIAIANGMKPPLPESEEIKYLTQIIPVDVFANLDENAFAPSGRIEIPGQPRDLRSLEEMPEDLIEDEVPFNSQLIESYYPSNNLPTTKPFTGQGPVTSFHEHVKVLEEEPLTFDDTYFQTGAQVTATDSQFEKPNTVVARRTAIQANVRNAQLIWNLHDGYDWQNTRDAISKAVQDLESAAASRRHPADRATNIDEAGGIEVDVETYDVLFNSIYITLPSHKNPGDLSRDIQQQIGGEYDMQSETGSYAPTLATTEISSRRRPSHNRPRHTSKRYRRSLRNAMQIELKGVDVDFAIYVPDGLEIQNSIDVRVNDIQVTENVRTSTWRKFLTYMREAGVRESGLPMAHLHVDVLRPIPDLAATELSIKVKLLPLRLYVDQDALEFLTRFFEFKDPDAKGSTGKVEEPFIQRCEIDTVRVKLDFKPKRVDYAGLRSGRTTEFMNFFILEEADMELRHVALNGVSGFERLGKDLNNIWMPDIKSNQLGGVLAGVAPVRSLVNIGTGVRDLVKVPIIEYRKDGRVVRSIKKGAHHFIRTSGSEFARLGAKLALGTQTILEKTEELLGGEPSTLRREMEGSDDESNDLRGVISPYAEQPLGVYSGLVQARHGLVRNMNEAKEAILRVPAESARGGSATGAAAAVMKATPTAVIRPIIGVAEAVHKTLHGIDNAIDHEKREKTREKYKSTQ